MRCRNLYTLRLVRLTHISITRCITEERQKYKFVSTESFECYTVNSWFTVYINKWTKWMSMCWSKNTHALYEYVHTTISRIIQFRAEFVCVISLNCVFFLFRLFLVCLCIFYLVFFSCIGINAIYVPTKPLIDRYIYIHTHQGYDVEESSNAYLFYD